MMETAIVWSFAMRKGRSSGDVLLGIYALDALKYSALGRIPVVTVQSNLGLDFAVKEAGGQVERVDVGDRNVAEKMRVLALI